MVASFYISDQLSDMGLGFEGATGFLWACLDAAILSESKLILVDETREGVILTFDKDVPQDLIVLCLARATEHSYSMETI